MGPGIISFMFAIGSATWLYTKLQKYSGNNTKQSAIAAGAAFLAIFVVFYLFVSIIVK